MLAHLRCGSVTAAEGDTLTSGDQLGEVGNSLLPHIHVHAMTTADPLTATVLRWKVCALDRHLDGAWATAPGQVPLRAPVRSP